MILNHSHLFVLVLWITGPGLQ